MATVTEPRSRPTLSRELIRDTALRLTLEQPNVALTLARLGNELEADPTAVYRHFRNRNELMLELGDHLFTQILDQLELDGEWHESLETIARLTRDVMLQRPALATEVATRATGGPGERASVELVNSIMEAAGFEGRAIADNTRAFGELLLAIVVSAASYLILPTTTRSTDDVVVRNLYDLDPSRPADAIDEVFDLVIATYIAGLRSTLSDPTRPTEEPT